MLPPALSILLALQAAAWPGAEALAAHLAGCAGLDPGRLGAVGASVAEGMSAEEAAMLMERVAGLAAAVAALAAGRSLCDDEVGLVKQGGERAG